MAVKQAAFRPPFLLVDASCRGLRAGWSSEKPMRYRNAHSVTIAEPGVAPLMSARCVTTAFIKCLKAQ
jgi:hypothetical protein